MINDLVIFEKEYISINKYIVDLVPKNYKKDPLKRYVKRLTLFQQLKLINAMKILNELTEDW
ncbi:MAG: hypothetical protein GY870_12500 [archaeon]|nr:hypothetical protein [archaeon]